MRQLRFAALGGLPPPAWATKAEKVDVTACRSGEIDVEVLPWSHPVPV
jgi:hypothetical protein